jgi:hypothetical protein
MTNSQALSLKALDWRGIRLFLVLCFGLTWTMEISALAYGTRFDALSPATLALLGLIMLIPAGSAFSVRRWLTREGFASAGLRLGPCQPYVFVWLGVPCLFGVIYILTGVLGLGVFSTDLSLFLRELPPLPPGKQLPPTPVLLCTLGFASLTVGLLITSLFTFGEEFGWTGYLLPKLLPLGRWRAVAIYGAIWGLWHAPVIAGGFNYPGHPVSGIALMCIFTTAIGMVQCTLLIRDKSVILTSFLHGAINSQARGIWPVLFTSVAPLWGGVAGLLGCVVIGVLGVLLMVGTKSNPARA